jgi:glycosyltransferase involved in cell wall biosynthesis
MELDSWSSDESKSGSVAYLSRWIGDYHAPRLLALQSLLAVQGRQLSVVQFGARSYLYMHKQTRRNHLVSKLHFANRPCQTGWQEGCMTWSELNRIRPRDILVLGYNDPISLTAALWARSHGARVHFLSDSKADDQPRRQITEVLKRIILKIFDGALVAGTRHVEYFRSLGFKGPIETPYDVIDNKFFAIRSQKYRRRAAPILQHSLPAHYVLCVSRLVPRKRVTLALDLYAASGLAAHGVAFVLVGDGPERGAIYAKAAKLGLDKCIHNFPNIANHRMPAVYGGASALILASEYDQWGLCVNEAMSCGVPAFVTPRCGVANEIVTEETGVIFTPETLEVAGLKLRRCALDPLWRASLSNSCLKKMTTCNVEDFAQAVMRLTQEPSE